MAFLEKTLQRMRKKEENVVQRKAVQLKKQSTRNEDTKEKENKQNAMNMNTTQNLVL